MALPDAEEAVDTETMDTVAAADTVVAAVDTAVVVVDTVVEVVDMEEAVDTEIVEAMVVATEVADTMIDAVVVAAVTAEDTTTVEVSEYFISCWLSVPFLVKKNSRNKILTCVVHFPFCFQGYGGSGGGGGGYGSRGGTYNNVGSLQWNVDRECARGVGVESSMVVCTG